MPTPICETSGVRSIQRQDNSTVAEFLTTEQLAERWQVSARNIRDMAAAGELPAMKLGKLWRFPVESVQRFERLAVAA